MIELNRGHAVMTSIVNYCAQFPEEDSKRLNLSPPFSLEFFRQLEEVKLKTVARLAREVLESNPECHVVICLRFVDHLNLMMKAMREFAPSLILSRTTRAQDTRLVMISRQAFRRRQICWELHSRRVFFALPIRFDEQLRVDFRHPDTVVQVIYDQKHEAELSFRPHQKYGQYPRVNEV